MCDGGRKISFLCPNGTIFRQSHLICDWWFRVDCERSPDLYDESVQHLQADQNVYKQKVEVIANAMQNAFKTGKNLKDSSLLESPASSSNKNNFNSEFGLPARNEANSSRGKSTHIFSTKVENHKGFDSVTSPPHLSTIGTSYPAFSTDFPTTLNNIRFSQSNAANNKQSTSFTFATTTYEPDATPLIHNFLGADNEQQVLAETAAFAGKGKYQLQNYYYSMNFVKHPSKETYSKGNNGNADFTTSFQPADTTQYQTEAYTGVDDSFFRTTANSNNFPVNDYRNFNSSSDNSSYALYFSSMNGLPVPLNFDPNLVNGQPSDVSTFNASKPAVSEYLLNSQQGTKTENNQKGENLVEQSLPLLTNMTQEGYNQLFPKEEIEGSQSNFTSLRVSDLESEHSSGIVQSSSQKPLPLPPPSQKQTSLEEKFQFKSSPDLRELAQVFSRALSAYLENPEQFRKILTEVRPTEPPSLNDVNNGEASAVDDEVLAFSEDIGTRSAPKSAIKSSTQSVNSYPVTPNKVTSPASHKATVKTPETFAEEINNFMFGDGRPYVGPAESGEFNINETYYPSSQSYRTTGTTLPITIKQYTVSPLIDVTVNASSRTTFSQLPSTTLPNVYKQLDNNNFLHETKNLKAQPEFETVSQSLSDKEHILTADTQSFVSRDNLLKYQNLNANAAQNYKNQTSKEHKPTPKNFIPQYSESIAKFNSDYQSVKSSKNTQFGQRTTAAAKSSPYISSRADYTQSSTLAPPTTPPLSKTQLMTKATTYHPETRTTRFSTAYTEPLAYATNLDNSFRDSKSLYQLDKAKDLSPNAPNFNETAKTLISMMEEAKTNNLLRNQLVLLLVNDKSLPTDNRSVKEMKSKLLKALLKPATSEKATTKSYVTDAQTTKSLNTVTASRAGGGGTPPPHKTRKERVVVHKHKIVHTSTELSFSKSTENSQQFSNARSERSTSKPIIVPSAKAATELPDISDSDSRAVDLLKTLYRIASNNFS